MRLNQQEIDRLIAFLLGRDVCRNCQFASEGKKYLHILCCNFGEEYPSNFGCNEWKDKDGDGKE